MNPTLEAKLIELMEEAERQVAPAMCAVLDMLYGAYLNGKQNEFAQHCCRLSPIQVNGVTVNSTNKPKPVQSDGFWTDPVPGSYSH